MEFFRKFKPLILVLFVAFVFTMLFSAFTVQETERGIVKRLGKIRLNSDVATDTDNAMIITPGLHFKMPLLDTVLLFDIRIQTLEIPNSRIPTAEKKELLIDLFTKWKITDLIGFYKSTNGDIRNAEKLLSQKVIDVLRAEIGRRNLTNVVSNERQEILDKLRIEANKTAISLGVQVVDVRIMRLDLPEEVSDSVYNLMRAERKRVAMEHRAKGLSDAEKIRAEADAKAVVLLANASNDAKHRRAEGEAEAARLSNLAYMQDPEFYSFYRNMAALLEAFNKNGNKDTMVIKPDGDFFKYFSKKK